jgi:hypothetical protein
MNMGRTEPLDAKIIAIEIDLRGPPAIAEVRRADNRRSSKLSEGTRSEDWSRRKTCGLLRIVTKK